jgi:adenylate cyclase class 2
MHTNSHEVEIKFKIDDPNLIRKILKREGMHFIGKAFEKTFRFDTADKNLEQRGQFLRVRTGFKNVITFKRKIKNEEFKEREEVELEISDAEKMKMILENLGFTKILIMEKYREKWRSDDIEIVIDRLPMGMFIEIEGEEKVIKEMVKTLGFDFKDRITGTYWDLWREFSKKENIKNENIIFNLILRRKKQR